MNREQKWNICLEFFFIFISYCKFNGIVIYDKNENKFNIWFKQTKLVHYPETLLISSFEPQLMRPQVWCIAQLRDSSLILCKHIWRKPFMLHPHWGKIWPSAESVIDGVQMISLKCFPNHCRWQSLENN